MHKNIIIWTSKLRRFVHGILWFGWSLHSWRSGQRRRRRYCFDFYLLKGNWLHRPNNKQNDRKARNNRTSYSKYVKKLFQVWSKFHVEVFESPNSMFFLYIFPRHVNINIQFLDFFTPYPPVKIWILEILP